MKILLNALIVLVMTAGAVFAQKKAGVDTLTIKSSMQCGMCAENVIHALDKVKGVKDVEVDMEQKTVTVAYKSNKTSPEALRKAISMAGYDADNQKADATAHDNLPKCCQKGGH